ncbi:hypothetical protein ACIBI4_09005 [Streptomyces sp. NPDC050418]|uniref:hypothetical protein n=1 Tax=Streptomyces sp. NPDC050418 TaxID=3365612 RepID=UPI0037BA3EAC
MRRSVIAIAGIALLLAGCGSADPDGKQPSDRGSSPSKSAPASPLTWEFEHIADFSGKLTDVAALSTDDIWAVTARQDGGEPELLHYDGSDWKQQPLPDALGDSTYPPRLEEVGEDELWLSPDRYGPAGTSWARWDGTQWSAVPQPPPGQAYDIEAVAADDIWTLDSERDEVHHWDGARWTTTALKHQITDLAVVGPDDVWVAGHRESGPGTGRDYYTQPASQHFDGTAWRDVETPVYRFPDPVPPEAGATIGQLFVTEEAELFAYGSHSYNHGEVENEPADETVQLRWDGSRWQKEPYAPDACARRVPVAAEAAGLFLNGNWYLTDDGACVKIKRHRLPEDTGARKTSQQSLWLEEIHKVPGTDEWLGAGHVQVNQSGDPFGAPVVVRLKRAS